jgi:hypothetical protein
MDYGEIISDSIDYSRNALVRNWKIWLALIACGLPFALMNFLFDPEKMQTTGYWNDFPWGQFIALLLAGFLLSFLAEGYVVRVLRGFTPPPEFDNWVSLYLDGIKVLIVQIIWFIPVVVVFGITVFFFAFADAIKGSGLAMPMRIGVLLLIVVAIVFTILILLCISIAVVRYARTGSIREGIRYSAVLETIRAIGWGSYILALIVLLITAIIYFLVLALFAMIPFIGWVLNLALSPFFFVFSARYFSRVYDNATPLELPVSAPAAGV